MRQWTRSSRITRARPASGTSKRKIATICRKIARESLKNIGNEELLTITPDSVERYLGRRRFQFEVVEEKDRVGVATGLVRTEAGGEIIFVEAAQMKGNSNSSSPVPSAK